MEKWLQEVSWLQTDDQRTVMWCKICRDHPNLADKSSAFYIGTKNFSHPPFEKHEKSKEHVNIVQTIASRRSSQDRSRPLDRWQDKINEEQRQALSNIFLLAFHKAKHARPMRSFEEDVPLLQRLDVNVGTAYHSREGGTQIIETIAKTISSELHEKLKASEFWGLLFDGSADINKIEQEIVYIVSVSSDGEYSLDFLGLINLGAQRTAQDIVDGLVQLFHDCGLADEWRTKLVSVCTDGAPVNVGKYSGVIPKLRERVVIGDALVHILCTAHTLENCAKSADRMVPYCESSNRSVVKVLCFYLQKGGAKELSQLKLCDDNGIAFVKLGKFHNIRWSAWRQETLLKIWRLLPAIQIQLATSDDSDLKHVCTERFHCFLANMLDTGKILQSLSLKFQQDKLTIGECKDELMVAIGQLTLLVDSDDQQYRKEAVAHVDADRDKNNVLTGLIEELESRYESLKSCDQFLIFDPSTWPQEMKDLHSFGNTTLGGILQNYEASMSVDRESTLREWMRLKQSAKRFASSSVYDLVEIVKTSDPETYSNIWNVILLSLTLPLSSAACERGFSHLNIIKNKYRSCLSDSRLSSLMHIHMSKMTTETFDPKPAVDLWMQTADCRLNQGRGSRPATSTKTTMGMVESSDDDDEDVQLVA